MYAVAVELSSHHSRNARAVSSRAVVGPEVLGSAALGRQPLEHRDRLVGVDRAIDLDRQGLAGELVDDVEELELAAVGGRVVLEVQRPQVAGVGGAQAICTLGG